MTGARAVTHDFFHAALDDGRALAYCEFGDPDGLPMFYFHGFPGSRLEGAVAANSARRAGVRLIAVDRRGFGNSDPLPRRRLLDWPADIVQLAQRLELDRFGVVTASGGAPYAAACARAIPERLTVVGNCCGTCPAARDAPEVRHVRAESRRPAPGCAGSVKTPGGGSGTSVERECAVAALILALTADNESR